MPDDFPASPAELLALEEALLEYCEESAEAGFLHFWEAEQHFVVLGYSKKMAEEIHSEACRDAEIPILRRATGGGTVLQGPGSFNYTLVLPIEGDQDFATIRSTNIAVMERHRSAFDRLMGRPTQVRGYTDLTIGDRKFSGNAQRRKRRCFLFHGAFLLGLDLSLVERTLKPPMQQPEYRQQRGHRDFLMNLPLRQQEVEGALRSCWSQATVLPKKALPPELLARMQHLVTTKYGREEWNQKF